MLKIKMLALYFGIICFLSLSLAQAQQTRPKYANRFGFHENPYLIDTPTAGMLDLGFFDTSIRMYANGGLLGRFHIGLSDKFMFGVSYGGENIIGEGKVNWNPQPGINLRWRLKAEDYNVPAVVLGFDSQGYGKYIDVDIPHETDPNKTRNIKRYTIKSRGFFVAFSKNYTFFNNIRNNFGVHVGANYSLETKDRDRDFTVFTGFDLRISDELSILGDYDFATNDDEKDAFGKGKGYFNLAARWYFINDFFLQFAMKNILENKENLDQPIREIKIVYTRSMLDSK